MYEIHDLAGDRVERGYGETVFEDPRDALNDAFNLGRAAVERLQAQTTTP